MFNLARMTCNMEHVSLELGTFLLIFYIYIFCGEGRHVGLLP